MNCRKRGFIGLAFVGVFTLFLFTSCSNRACYDGAGEDSYYDQSQLSVEIAPLQITTPEEIEKIRIAYRSIECQKPIIHYANIDGEMREVTGAEFEEYVHLYNTTCVNCLQMYESGCC